MLDFISLSSTKINFHLTIASTGLGALKPGSTDANLEAQAPRQLSEMLGRRRIRGAIKMKTTFNGYQLSSQCKLLSNARYSVSVLIEKTINGQSLSAFFKDNGISLILEIEAEKESVNFGKNLIKQGLIDF
jgi:hypothetical protein